MNLRSKLDLRIISKSLTLSLLSFFLIAGVLYAATTIGSNITTAGTLQVDTTSTLTGAVSMGSTATVTGVTQLNGQLQATTTSLFTGQATFYSDMKVAPAYGLDASSAGVLNFGTTTATTINIGGTQATTKVLGLLKVPAAYGIDTATAGVLNIGTTTATQINIGNTASAATTMNLATSNAANIITMGDITGPPVGTVRLSGATVTAQGGLNYGADAGSNDSYAITLAPALTGYVPGQMIVFTVNTANTEGATINVNGLGAQTLVKGADAALATNDLIVNRTYVAVYDGTNFDVINPTTQ